MPRPRDTLEGSGVPDVLSGHDVGPVSGGGGSGGGYGSLGFGDPIGLPPELQSKLGDLNNAVMGQAKVEALKPGEPGAMGLPAGIDPSTFTPAQANGYAARAKAIQASAPGIAGPLAAPLIFSGMPIEQAIRLARVSAETARTPSWWEHIPGIKPVGSLLHSAFIDAPEWLWRKTIVDPFQEIGELMGVDPAMAQRLSPGQVVLAGLAHLEDESDNRGMWQHGELVDPEEWDDKWRWVSGGLDLVARLTLDPTMWLGNIRKGLILGEAGTGLLGSGLHYVSEGAGASRRVSKLRLINELNPERANAIGKSLIEGGRTKTLVNYLFGNTDTGDVMRSLVTGHTGIRRFVDDLVDLKDSPTLAAEIIKRYGAPRKGYGMRIEHAAFLEDAVKRAGTRGEAFRGAEEALISLVTGTFTPYTREHMDEVVQRWNSTVAMRHDAVRRWEKLRKVAGETTDDTRITVSGPRVDGFGTARYAGEGELGAEASLAAIEVGASRERAFAGEAADDFPDAQSVKFYKANTTLSEESYKGALGEVDDEIKGISDELHPFVDVWQADPAERKAILGDMLEIRDQMGVNLPMAEWPAEKILDVRVPGLGGRPLREMPVLKALNMVPHRSVNVHDPYWHDQVTRVGRRAGMKEDEITGWIDRIIRDGKTPQSTAGIMTEFVRDTYTKIGLSSDDIDDMFHRVSANSQKVFARVDGTTHDAPLYSSQALNIVQLTDPKMVNAVRRFSTSPGFARLTAQQTREGVVQILDQANTVFKRLMVATPRTGLRVLLEGQARALAYGFSSIYKNPIHALVAFPMSVFAPGLAQKSLEKLSAKHLREIAVRSGDIGMAQILYESGLLSKEGYRNAQVLSFGKMKGGVMKHNYRKAQANFINDIMLNDDLVRRVLLDGDDVALAWLKDASNQGAQVYRDSITSLRTAKNLEGEATKHFKAIRTNITEMGLDDDAVRSIVTGIAPGRVSQVKASDLIGKEAKEIVGASIWHGEGNALNKILDVFINRHLGSIENIGRDYTTRRELYRETWTRVSHAEAAGQKIDDEAVKVLLAGGVVKNRGAEHALVTGARRDVQGKVKFLFQDLAEQSRFAEMFRFAFPFGNAYQEVAQTWGRILTERPWVPHIASVLWNEVDDIPGVTFTDPATGEKMFRVPLAGHLLRFAGLKSPNLISGMPDDVGWEFSGKLSGFNLISSGLPIPGPMAQVPLRLVLKNKPQFDDIWQVLFPYGDTDLIDSFQPGFVRQARALVESYMGKEESNQEFAGVLSDLAAEEYFGIVQRWMKSGGEGDLPSLDRVDTDGLIEKTRKIFAMRTASKLLFPASIMERSPLKDDLSFYRYLQSVDPTFADQVMASRTGSPAYKVLVEAETELWPDKPWAPPTKKAQKMLMEDGGFKDFISTFGQPGWDAFFESWTGELDSDFIRDQILSGDRRRRTSTERLAAAQTSVAWDYYFQFVDSLEQRMNAVGIANFQDKRAVQYAQAKAQFTQRLSQSFPEWGKDLEKSGGGSKVGQVASLAIMANMPDLQRLDSIQGLKEYFTLRARVGDLYRTAEIGFDSRKGLQLKMQFRTHVRAIIAKHPHFARMWGRYLERDDPTDSLVDRTGDNGVLKRGILSRSSMLDQQGVRTALERGLVY